MDVDPVEEILFGRFAGQKLKRLHPRPAGAAAATTPEVAKALALVHRTTSRGDRREALVQQYVRAADVELHGALTAASATQPSVHEYSLGLPRLQFFKLI